MRVYAEPIDGTSLDRLYADHDVPDMHIYEDDHVGYWCAECRVVDETLRQLYHEDDECPHHGSHGREVYGTNPPWAGWDMPDGVTDPDHPMLMLWASDHDTPRGIGNGQHIGAVCNCGAADEDVAELVHDECCPLAGDEKVRTAVEPRPATPRARVASDGGRPE